MSGQTHIKAYVVAVNMGYGHERAAYALKHLAHKGEIIIANNYKGIPASDRRIWRQSRAFYESISRMRSIPFIGEYLFDAYDRLQEIPPFYPHRDLSKPNLQLTQIYRLIRKKNFLRDLIVTLAKNPKPLITTFFVPAFAADVYDYPGDIYCVLTDTDVSRSWAPLDPKKSRIKYIAPNGRVVERMKSYGVPAEQIFLTGFPIPPELIGGEAAVTVKTDLNRRICRLDPNGIFVDRNKETILHYLGPQHCNFSERGREPATVAFAVGGAGAQMKLGRTILESLQSRIGREEIKLILVAGVRKEVADYFTQSIKDLRLGKKMGKSVDVFYRENRVEYFRDFTRLLRSVDVLWTKPSELSFYAGVGIPIIMTPPLGSQEKCNRMWLKTVVGGFDQDDPRYTHEWLFDWIESGGLARMAWQGYIEAPTHGAYRVDQIISGHKYNLASLPLIV